MQSSEKKTDRGGAPGDVPAEGRTQTSSAPAHDWRRLTSASHKLLLPPRSWTRVFALVIVAAVVGTVVWADQAELEEFTSGIGRVIPARKTQVVQNLEGGIVKQILVRDGQRVKKGEILFRIDTTGSGSELEQRREKLAGLRIRAARLRAEINQSKPVFPPELVKSHAEIIRLELSLLKTREEEYQATLKVLRQQGLQKDQEIKQSELRGQFTKKILDKVKEEIAEIRPMVQRKLTPKVDLIRLVQRALELEREIQLAKADGVKARAGKREIEQRIRERTNGFVRMAQDELNKIEVEIASLVQAIKGYRDRVKRADVRSPVNGIIKDTKVTTVGEVVKPGMALAEIVPQDDTLVVEANVSPSDIAFLRPGQGASVKITAYDFSIYGSLDGKLEEISADTITDEKGNRFFRILVRTDRNFLTFGRKKLPIIPGMVAQVDIVTGRKTILQYVLKPFNKIRQKAMREK